MSGSYTVEKKTLGETLSTTRQRFSHNAVRYPSAPRSSRGAHDTVPRHAERQERAMGEELRVPITVMVSITPLPQAAGSTLQVERVTIAPSFPTSEPLLHHIARVLQVAIAGESIAGQPSAQSLADALVTPFLRRYGVPRPSPGEVTGGLSPYKLRRTIAYIKDHLEQVLSLVTLAAVGETSPAHFARLFKQATGLPPHQYVLRCRMERAKQLLAETDVPLSEIALQVGCADQSHFTALFRTHFALTPKAYRDHIRR
jgi:AraC family transcriptional regulator